MEERHALTIFYSYADVPEDRMLCEQLEKHLGTLKQLDLIKGWHARNIQAGLDWEHEARSHLNEAQVILLLISADFIVSDYCYSKEMRYALDQQRAGKARVIPILLRSVDWRGTPFENLAVLPSNKKPVTLWHNVDAAFTDVATGIRTVIENWPNTLLHFPFTIPHLPVSSSRAVAPYPTIDTHAAVELFQQLMQPDGHLRILGLIGDGKMGKSHLLTKVFPSIARRDQVYYATLDVRNRLYGVPETLKMIGDLIDPGQFQRYSKAYQSWLHKSNFDNFKARFFFWQKKRLDCTYYSDLYLTQQFIMDVQHLRDRPFLLLFDSIDLASENIRRWLTDTLLVQLLHLSHVRIVIAGRRLPDMNGSYTAFSALYQLKPVREDAEYLAYCQRADLVLEEKTISAFAYACDYIPGAFVDLVLPKFLRPGAIYG